MSGKSLLQMVYEQKVADENEQLSASFVPAVFVAVFLFVVVFVVGAALDTAWVHLQQWYQVITGYWPF